MRARTYYRLYDKVDRVRGRSFENRARIFSALGRSEDAINSRILYCILRKYNASILDVWYTYGNMASCLISMSSTTLSPENWHNCSRHFWSQKRFLTDLTSPYPNTTLLCSRLVRVIYVYDDWVGGGYARKSSTWTISRHTWNNWHYTHFLTLLKYVYGRIKAIELFSRVCLFVATLI